MNQHKYYKWTVDIAIGYFFVNYKIAFIKFIPFHKILTKKGLSKKCLCIILWSWC